MPSTLRLPTKGGPPLHSFSFARSNIFDERSTEYFVTTMEAKYEQKVSEFSPEGPKRDEHWAIIEHSMETCNEWYDEEQGKWLMGDIFSMQTSSLHLASSGSRGYCTTMNGRKLRAGMMGGGENYLLMWRRNAKGFSKDSNESQQDCPIRMIRCQTT
ncbi:hypothetical protein EDC04DRAFT_1209497 [Pisolithus marmoratus]|nr:hypothetical protein EDC04DRAFT_1209497 [Pisolithus marmoratus]